MSAFTALLRLQLKTTYGSPTAFRRLLRNPKEALGEYGKILIALVAVVGLMVAYTVMLSKAFGPLRQAGLEQLVLLAGILVPLVLVLVLGFFQVLGTFFFARDAEHLASLPVPARAVFAAKLGVVMVGQYATAIPLLAVPTVYYGIKMGCGVAYYAELAVLSLLLPAIPVAAASIVSLLLMRAVSAVRRQSTVLSVAGLVLMVGFIAGEAALMNAASSNMTNQLIDGLVKNQVDLIAIAGRYFPPIEWAVRALADSGVSRAHALSGASGASGGSGAFNLLLFAAASVAAAWLAILASSTLYQKGALVQAEAERGRRTRGLRVCRQSSITTALFLREWRIILRTPVYALNSLVGIVLGPLMVNRSLFGGVMMKDPDVKPFFDRLASAPDVALAMLLVAAVVACVGLINMAAPTTISREGRMFWLSKAIPVAPGQQVTAKFLAGYSISVLAVLTTALALCPSFHIGIVPSLGGVVLALVALYSIVAADVLLDVLNPKLVWANPTEAIKQNMNGLYALIVGVGFAAIGGYAGYQLESRGFAAAIIFAVLIGFYVPLGIGVHSLLIRVADRRYRAIGG